MFTSDLEPVEGDEDNVDDDQRSVSLSPYTEANQDPNPEHYSDPADLGTEPAPNRLPLLQAQDWSQIQRAVERTNQRNLRGLAADQSPPRLRINNAIFDVGPSAGATDDRTVQSTGAKDDATVLIPKESDTCQCDTLYLCEECRCFPV